MLFNKWCKLTYLFKQDKVFVETYIYIYTYIVLKYKLIYYYVFQHQK